MSWTRPGTLEGMDRDALIAYVLDRTLEHGGDMESLFADLRNKLTGTEPYIEHFPTMLSQGMLFALNALFVFQEVDAEMLQLIRDGGSPAARGCWSRSGTSIGCSRLGCRSSGPGSAPGVAGEGVRHRIHQWTSPIGRVPS